MIEETIARIEERLRTADTLDSSRRAELQELLEQLRKEARSLPPGALPAAECPEDEDPSTAISRLQASLTSFETSHPQLTGAVNRISTFLANLGI